jgi:putative hydrolase of the HAD superfamily
LSSIKAVIFDFIGTLTNVKNYRLEISERKLCKAIAEAGFDIGEECFLEAYGKALEKYRLIRYQELVEVTNAVWISEALNSQGFKTSPEDACIKSAVNLFFEDYLSSLELRPYVKKLLSTVSAEQKLGLISNFTYAPVIYAGLRRLDISQFFDAILVSEDVGWRKPHANIFKEAIKKLGVLPEETVYVGDSPLEDIKGAKAVGMKTVFIPSQFYTLKNLNENQQSPELVVHNSHELYEKLPKFISNIL